jgi:hypothetical protein
MKFTGMILTNGFSNLMGELELAARIPFLYWSWGF